MKLQTELEQKLLVTLVKMVGAMALTTPVRKMLPDDTRELINGVVKEAHDLCNQFNAKKRRFGKLVNSN